MLFTSAEFVLFFSFVFLLYWLVLKNSLILQNLFLLAAGYFFYGWWSWKFLLLLIAVSLVNWLAGLWMAASSVVARRRMILVAGLLINTGTLVVFKYYNFFMEGFVSSMKALGIPVQASTLGLLLPVGISFYIFVGISYIVDVYRRKLEPEKKIIPAMLSFSFFPVILAGPVERPVALLPQVNGARVFDAELAVDGIRQFVWGLFMKMVVANNCGVFTGKVFNSAGQMPGISLLLGAIFFAVQIYADFSGYSDMAIGIGKMLGFRIRRNFAFPYFAGDIAEFWRRWNISLISWFRDYIFLPVAYFISGRIRQARFLFIKTELFIYIMAILITWTLTGLWHGANYTFILWGMIHGLMLIFYHIIRKPKQRLLRRMHPFPGFLLRAAEYLLTMLVVLAAWVFFKSAGIHQAFDFLAGIFSSSETDLAGPLPRVELVVASAVAFLVEFIQRNREFPLQLGQRVPTIVRWTCYYGIVLVIVFFGGGQKEFLYFQF